MKGRRSNTSSPGSRPPSRIPPRRATSVRRRGGVTLEMIIACPVLLLATVAIAQFGPTMTVHHAVQSAAREAAREATKVPNFDPSDDSNVVASVVNEILGVHGLTIGANTGVMAIIEDNTEVECIGDMSVTTCPAMTSVTNVDEIKVTVLVKLADAPVPNLLNTFGINLSTKRYEFVATERRE